MNLVAFVNSMAKHAIVSAHRSFFLAITSFLNCLGAFLTANATYESATEEEDAPSCLCVSS